MTAYYYLVLMFGASICQAGSPAGFWRQFFQRRTNGPSRAQGRAVAACPDGWLSASGHCFYFASDDSTWLEAGEHCRSFGRMAHLFRPESQELQDAVFDLMTAQNIILPANHSWAMDYNKLLNAEDWIQTDFQAPSYVTINESDASRRCGVLQPTGDGAGLVQGAVPYDAGTVRAICQKKSCAPQNEEDEENEVDFCQPVRDEGIDPFSMTDDGYTQLYAAVKADNTTLVRLLLDCYRATGDLSMVDLKFENAGWTALHYAGEYGNVEVINLLLGAGADINLGEKEGTNALHYAAKYGQLEATKVLVAAGALVDLQEGYHGYTPLHWNSAGRGVRGIAVVLVETGGADTTILDHAGDTATTVAFNNNYSELWDYLYSFN